MKQPTLFALPRKCSVRRRKLARPPVGSPPCDNLRRHKGKPPTICGHKGRMYRLHGWLELVLCPCCCARLLKKQVSLRRVA